MGKNGHLAEEISTHNVAGMTCAFYFLGFFLTVSSREERDRLTEVLLNKKEPGIDDLGKSLPTQVARHYN